MQKNNILSVWDRVCDPNPESPNRLPTLLFIGRQLNGRLIMKDPHSEKFPPHLKYNLFTSPAFLDLKPASKMILILFYYEVLYHKAGSRGKFYPINLNEIILPYKEIRERLKYTDKTIWTSIKDILAHGFLKVSSYGGKARGDFQIYSIKTSWESWEPGDTKFNLMAKSMLGFQKKGSKPV